MYLRPDSTEAMIPYHDTVSFRYIEQTRTRKRKKDEDEPEEEIKKEMS